MKYPKLGDTDLKVSEITFGAWAAGGWMWGGTEEKAAVEAIQKSYDLGVTSIDTAPVYGQGLSEQIVGKAVNDIPRDKIQILTKYGMRWDLEMGDFAMDSMDNAGNPLRIFKYAGKESVIKECEDSLKRLGTDYIDLYQIHWPDSTTPVEETMEAVMQLKKQGKIREAGVCNYKVHHMKEAEKTLSLASNQVPYSMVNRDIENELVPFCRKHNKSILAYSPLQRGLLTGKMKPGQEFKKGDHRADNHYFSDENIKKVNKFLDDIKPIASEKNASLAQIVIQWTLRQPGITVALVGARNQEQAAENAQAATISFTSEEAKFIDDKLELLRLEK